MKFQNYFINFPCVAQNSNYFHFREAAAELDWAREEKVLNADPALVKHLILTLLVHSPYILTSLLIHSPYTLTILLVLLLVLLDQWPLERDQEITLQWSDQIWPGEAVFEEDGEGRHCPGEN